MKKSISYITILFAGIYAAIGFTQVPVAVDTKQIDIGELSVIFRDNSRSPEVLSGIQSLFHIKDAPGFDAFDPDTRGASAGLNFEHIISGHKNPDNKFTPRHGTFELTENPDRKSVTLTRRAEDSPWKVDSIFTYTVVEPHYIDFDFQCSPRDAAKFGSRSYAIFFFANYMNDVADAALHFRGHADANAPEQWISANAPPGPADWNGGGNYRSIKAEDLEYDDDVQFRLNTWSYDWPRFSKPFYYGRAERDMTLILMFDRMFSDRDQIRFSLYKFKMPKYPRPAWDFQYVINSVNADEQYGFSGRLVWKRFVSEEDCVKEYDRWSKALHAKRVRQLRELGATVFTHTDKVVEINANRCEITDETMALVESFHNLTDLSLEGTQVSNAGIAYLHSMRKLEWLNLYRCPVGDRAMEQLKRLPRLQHLPIGSTNVTDAGLQHLQEMRQLEYLGLRNTQVTDQGIQNIKNLTNLTGLHLGETKITDEGVVALQGLNKLNTLWLDNTAVTDNCVASLANLVGLTQLHIHNTAMTEEGISRLRRLLPRCDIEASTK